MSWDNFIQSFIFISVLLLLIKPFGIYMARIYTGKKSGLNVWFAPVEKWAYQFSGINPEKEMSWKQYAFSVLLFNIIGIVVVYAIQRFQLRLPLNPLVLPPVAPDLAFNTAVSFATNTNWQNYGGETTLSYFTQMLGLTVQNFVSAATGMAVLVAFIRGFIQKQVETIGNFWVDLLRSTFYILLPLSLILSLALVSQGVVQTFQPSAKSAVIQPARDVSGRIVYEQIIALGPAASQVAIKQLGTNGGGFFNVNSAHPFENPTPFSNLLEVLAILLIAASLCYTFGYMVKDRRQGWAILAAMLIIFIPCLWGSIQFEQRGNPLLTSLGVDQKADSFQSGGNMEGKEARFGIANSAIW
ncbi:MAG: potassium-transporting ATPase subunit KdpA, partial [Candidatus Omnitrophica bacterium]|nr:potassium-transporting ATPase subunit KdpA [Candidatus Omnitrophota bacterium]